MRPALVVVLAPVLDEDLGLGQAKGVTSMIDRHCEQHRVAKMVVNYRLREYVQERLAGEVQRPDGTRLSGSQVAWKGRRHGRRKDRRWGRAWRPEQIAGRLALDFPDDPGMRISHEAIYQSLYVQGGCPVARRT